ncbi:MAG: hypothetical protein HZB53_05305 [Chloroflexi bacterium]|nr:hypothetical protein [Chloroflexota bacterium]
MALNVLYFGMLGPLSSIPLARLIEAGVPVRAVVLPDEDAAAPAMVIAPPPAMPRAAIVLQPAQPDIARLAHQARIPLVQAGDLRHAHTLRLLGSYTADVALVSCFARLIPRALRDLPRHGFLNLHPSLLPRLRGPAPLFWVFREGAGAGVAVHAMSGRLDAGDIVAQLPLDFPDGATYAEAERICAQHGVQLMLDLLAALARGALARQPQDELQATYRPAPGPADFVAPPDWPARHAFNFMRGVEGFGHARAMVDHMERTVLHAIEWRPDAAAGPEPGDTRWLRFADGAVRAQLAPVG